MIKKRKGGKKGKALQPKGRGVVEDKREIRITPAGAVCRLAAAYVMTACVKRPFLWPMTRMTLITALPMMMASGKLDTPASSQTPRVFA